MEVQQGEQAVLLIFLEALDHVRRVVRLKQAKPDALLLLRLRFEEEDPVGCLQRQEQDAGLLRAQAEERINLLGFG